MRHRLLSLAAIALAAPFLTAQTASVPGQPASRNVAASEWLAGRTSDLVGLMNGDKTYDALFTDSFRSAVPRAQFDPVTREITGALGRALRVETLVPVGPDGGRFTLRFERGTASGEIAVEPAAPHRIQGLRITGTQLDEQNIDAVLATLRGLRGTTALTFARLGEGAPAIVHQHNATTPLAIGSAFKLVILAELVRATNAGERRWDDPVTLTGAPLPGGGYTQKPRGTTVSLRELATQMISVSDNSATDILLAELGRDRVEAMLPVIGVRDGAGRNRPFLSTLDLFKLKGVDGGALGQRWQAASPAERRRLLDGPVAAAPLSAIPADLFQDRRPLSIDTIEWFASTADLVRIMDWLRRNSEGPGGSDVRAILSKNNGLGPAASAWRWAGYKGGSEPGVLNLTYLLQGKDGAWYALAATWNDPTQAVEDLRFMALVAQAATLGAPRAAP